MSELHFDNDGEPAQQHPQCSEVRWRRFRNPGMRGAPEVVHEKDGSQLYTLADITYLEFTTRVASVPGRYRGDQVDGARRLIPGATPFYVTITEGPRNANGGSATDELLKHLISANTRQTEVIAERFAGMMEQAAQMLRQTSEIFRIFTGANLLQRLPEPKERVEDDDDQEEEEETSNAEVIKSITDQAFPLIEMWLMGRAAKAAPPPSSSPLSSSPPSSSPPSPPPLSSPPPSSPPPSSPPPSPTVPDAGASGATPAAQAATAPEARNAAAVVPSPEQAQHLMAILQALQPDERKVARAVVQRMSAEQRAHWLGELSALTVDQAVELVRSMIPPRTSKGE